MTRKFNGIAMIVDDTPGNLALLSDTLSEAGYRVLVATDGISALEQIAYLKPDIILLDIMMPGIDGFETCNRLKSSPETADIPVLFMTALSELDNLLRGFDEGAVDYIVKPIRPPEVLARVDLQLTQARNLRRVENALNNSPFSALAIDSSGNITWLTPGGILWLDEFLQKHALTGKHEVGSPLPKPILEWVKQYLDFADKSESFESYRTGVGFLVKITPCQSTGEYLLVLDRHSGEWDLDLVRNSLGLTFREAEILMWISRGKTNKEVGIILGSSPRTINKHLEHIFEKLGVATRAAAVSMVLQRQQF
ncbi:MAG: response regulator transcription factor [Methylobacter sp.]|uniref:response regulator transcription factor n=1 Tax=Methylobacter sp. TaxID=2051955 RepID=UPI002730C64D|nr:response regulator transcription factor [Methylobacter sp.]MDP1666511.1 response regulator transcription factor [Methylobacter sp.]MDP1970682.1 response regulator transcription factor [Methylobacter sp.]